jgi:hypothetical protein
MAFVANVLTQVVRRLLPACPTQARERPERGNRQPATLVALGLVDARLFESKGLV